ncbi:hypothetical protein VQ045_20200 [Aurantimonas sp. E1-2-R+4]
MPVFVDPYAIEIRDDEWANETSIYIKTFFAHLLKQLRDGQLTSAFHMMSHLTEPQETFLGVSAGLPQGRGVGSGQSKQIISALRKSRAFQTGMLQDISELELYVEGIGPDKISDLTTNIIRQPLYEYTLRQCDLYNIPTEKYASPPIWVPDKLAWESRYIDLPYVSGLPVLLIPKDIARIRISINSQEFYNKHMIEFLKAEYERASDSLCITLKDGRKRAYKKDVKDRHPFIKDELAAFISENPKVLELYKSIKGAAGPLDNEAFDEKFSAISFCRDLTTALEDIPPGRKDADRYHKLMMATLNYTLYPSGTNPRVEWEINEGRKRIDIVYTNAAKSGFFERMRNDPHIQSRQIIVECKNYTSDIANEEFDQLSGRFDSRTRGRLGILTCRTVDDIGRIKKRCKDVASAGNGYIIVLTDKDITHMLSLISSLQGEKIDNFLGLKFEQILA